jgi:hypothetical protein
MNLPEPTDKTLGNKRFVDEPPLLWKSRAAVENVEQATHRPPRRSMSVVINAMPQVFRRPP